MAKTLEEIIEELRRFTTSELCDGVGAGKYHTMDSAIQERVTYKKIVGPAYTVKTPIGISGLIPDGILEMKKVMSWLSPEKATAMVLTGATTEASVQQ